MSLCKNIRLWHHLSTPTRRKTVHPYVVCGLVWCQSTLLPPPPPSASNRVLRVSDPQMDPLPNNSWIDSSARFFGLFFSWINSIWAPDSHREIFLIPFSNSPSYLNMNLTPRCIMQRRDLTPRCIIQRQDLTSRCIIQRQVLIPHCIMQRWTMTPRCIMQRGDFS